MSTKIYNGRKFKNTPKNLKEVRDIIFKFKEQVVEFYRDKYYRLLARDIVHMYDDAMLANKVFLEFPHRFEDDKKVPFGEQSITNSIWGLVSNAVDRKGELSNKSMERMNEYFQYEFSCSVTILPCKEEVFILLFTEDTDVQELFDAMEEIEEYPYWNNTDQPEGMTWEEWEIRGEEWDEAIGNGVPAQNGFDITILKDVLYVKLYPRNEEDVERNPFIATLKHIPETEKRVKRLVKMSMNKAWRKQDREAIDAILADSGKGNEYGVWSKTNKMRKQFMEDNTELAEKFTAELSEKIKKDFTEEDLRITVKDFTEMFKIEEETELVKQE
jgi:hypothetical protein